MAKYNGTYSCGHEGTINVTGPSKNRDWIAEHKFSHLCPECHQAQLEKERQKQNEAASLKSSEMQLPELTGSEKQVAWGNTIRINTLEYLENSVERYSNKREKFMLRHDLQESGVAEVPKDIVNLIHEMIQYLINNRVAASYWIDRRYNEYGTLLRFITEYCAVLAEKRQAIPEEIKIESTVSPETTLYNGVVEITGDDSVLKAHYEKNEDFIKIMHRLNLKWENGWRRTLTEKTGSFSERAAELGNMLLNAGFTICILDDIILKKAVSGDFEPECVRWVGICDDCFGISWPKTDSEKIYNYARKIPTSRWKNPCVIINISHFLEVEEFAEMFGFHFTKKALKYIDEYKASLSAVAKESPAPVPDTEDIDKLEEMLRSSDAIIDDLVEE